MDELQIPELKGIALPDSYVLGWRSVGDNLEFDVDFVIEPDHPNYSKPAAGEWACFMRGKLTFVGVKSVRGLTPLADAPSNLGPDGETDYGNIDALEIVDAIFRLDLEFCTAWIEAELVTATL